MKISLHLGNANAKSKETNKQINTETSGYELWHIGNKQKIESIVLWLINVIFLQREL